MKTFNEWLLEQEPLENIQWLYESLKRSHNFVNIGYTNTAADVMKKYEILKSIFNNHKRKPVSQPVIDHVKNIVSEIKKNGGMKYLNLKRYENLKIMMERFGIKDDTVANNHEKNPFTKIALGIKPSEPRKINFDEPSRNSPPVRGFSPDAR